MNLLPWRERPLKTIWRLEKNGQAGLVVGTAHFSPRSFEKTLRRLIEGSETVLFEGPLDEKSMDAVARYGRDGRETPSVYDALDPAVIRGINAMLAARPDRGTLAGAYLDLIVSEPTGFMEAHVRGVRPWMAFFTAWTAFLGWRHSMDMEAFRIAKDLGKRIECLETIPDQLAALDGIPFDRIVRYFNRYRSWDRHRESFTRVFLAGELDHYLSLTEEFPTRCEAIMGRRDPLFFQGIKNAFAQGPTTAFVGVGHLSGLRRLFTADGYRIDRTKPC